MSRSRRPTGTLQEAATPCNAPLGSDEVTNISCWLTPDLLAFSNSGGADNDIDTSYENWLPSFNVRFGIGDHQYARFGYSRAMSRPDFGLLRNFVGIQAPVLNNRPGSPYVRTDAAGKCHGLQLRVQRRFGLRRIEAHHGG